MRMKEQNVLTAQLESTSPWLTVQSLDDFCELRDSQLESSWWPDIGPLGDTASFSFTHRSRRLGPITVLDLDFHDEVWVNGGELRPHYHVTMPVAPSSSRMGSDVPVVGARGSVAVYRPEGEASVPGYVGRLLAVMIDRYAVEDALAEAIGRSVSSQIDLQPVMRTTTQAVRSWITLVSLFAEQLFRPSSILHQPMVGMPFAEGVVRGLLLATDHSYSAALVGEAIDPPPRGIGMAIDIIEAEAHLPLTISALAARSYMSVRSLQQGFRAHVGTTPMTYLREVRLRRAHQDLKAADPSVDTVASIAFRWGFANLGRFAAAYAAHYGERPALALRRQADSAIARQSRFIA
jgi:AraC-like DNA-binding protein